MTLGIESRAAKSDYHCVIEIGDRGVFRSAGRGISRPVAKPVTSASAARGEMFSARGGEVEHLPRPRTLTMMCFTDMRWKSRSYGV